MKKVNLNKIGQIIPRNHFFSISRNNFEIFFGIKKSESEEERAGYINKKSVPCPTFPLLSGWTGSDFCFRGQKKSITQ